MGENGGGNIQMWEKTMTIGLFTLMGDSHHWSETTRLGCSGINILPWEYQSHGADRYLDYKKRLEKVFTAGGFVLQNAVGKRMQGQMMWQVEDVGGQWQRQRVRAVIGDGGRVRGSKSWCDSGIEVPLVGSLCAGCCSWRIRHIWRMFTYFLHFLKNCYWSIVGLQCGVSFWCTAKQISHMSTYMPYFLDFLPI